MKRAICAALLMVAASLPATDLEERVKAAVEGSPEARQGFWGIYVVDAATGRVVFEQNADRFFVPASNTKLFTTALALHRLGPEYRFRTVVASDAAPDPKGRVREIRIIGGGDPNLSGRTLPYKRDSAGPNPLAPIEALADAVAARGVRIVDGDIVGDDTAYVWEPYPDGWAVDDPVWEYGAPVSALTINDNSFQVHTAPGPIGEPAKLTVIPSVEYFTIHNRTRTVAEFPAKAAIDRLPGSRELVVSGTVSASAGARTISLAVDDPAVFAAYALREALEERGVQVRGSVRAVHRKTVDEPAPTPGYELAQHTSVPLAQALTVINKESQNLHTELVLREVARAKDGVGTRRGGLEQIAAMLTEIGVGDKQYNFQDASGLSRLTLVTPLTVAKLLVHMYNSPLRDVWIATLPVGGQDGTLYDRFDNAPRAANIRAKTGSISHVTGLSGYALRSDGGVYVFSILANNFNAPSSAARKVTDQIALALLD